MRQDVLYDKTILVTRSPHQAKDMSRLIKSYGGTALVIPLLDFELNPLDSADVKRIEKLESYQWIIFTSANAVKFFMDHLEMKQLSIPSHTKIAVVGKKTAKMVASRGLPVEVIPEPFTTEGLLSVFSTLSKQPQTILLPLGQLAKPLLMDGLKNQGHHVNSIVVYKTLMNQDSVREIKKAVAEETFDVVTFTSPSSVQFFIQSLSGMDWKEHLNHVVVACIGTVTEQAAREYGFIPDIVPNVYTTASLVEAIAKYYYTNTR